ncbi:hypothetical protein K440DRAFT_636182 [Wilcoxina mikolae CBS 423.85]|nr:hypothetical protein K440DRAFT_636182 [Wilcoxina mikolae CBS 423.85]
MCLFYFHRLEVVVTNGSDDIFKFSNIGCRFLIKEVILKDVVVFANQFEWNGNVVNPSKVPWVLVGTGYAGKKMALLKDLYLETFYAEYSSSAPTQLTYQNLQCSCLEFEVVYRGMEGAGYKNCTERVRLTITPDWQLDAVFDGDYIIYMWQYVFSRPAIHMPTELIITVVTARFCTELGSLLPINSKPGQHRIGSIYDTIEHQQQLCYNQFKDGLSSGYLPKKLDVERMN